MESQSKQLNVEEVVKRENTEFDAVHPRFQTPPNEEELREYEVQHNYYCVQCSQFFAPTNRALNVHFDGKMVKHEPCGSCIYCMGPVYEYSFKNNRRLFHNCKKST